MPTWPVNLKPGSPKKTGTCSMIKILLVIFIFCFESIYSAISLKDIWGFNCNTGTNKKFDQKAIEKLTCDILKNPLPLSETSGDLNLDNFKFSNLFCFNVKGIANESKTKIIPSAFGDSILRIDGCNNFKCSNISLNQPFKLFNFLNLKLSQANINSFLKSTNLLVHIANFNLKDGTNISFPCSVLKNSDFKKLRKAYDLASRRPVMNSPIPTKHEETTNLNTLLVKNLTNDNSSTNIESPIKYFTEILNCNYFLDSIKGQSYDLASVHVDLSSVRVVLLRPLSSNNLNSSFVNRNNYSSFKLIFVFSSDSKLTNMIDYEEICQIKDTNMVNPRAADSNISIENLQVSKSEVNEPPMKSVQNLIPASESKSRGYYIIISNSSLGNGKLLIDAEYYIAKTFILFAVNLNCSQVDFTPISRKAIQLLRSDQDNLTLLYGGEE
jgi:hypothetical protein